MLLQGIFKIHSDLRLVVQLVSGMAHILIALNQPITWITPAGMKITQKYVTFNAKRIKTSLLKNTRPTTDIDKAKQAQAFSPNFTHSLDAINIYLLIQGFKRNQLNLPL